MAEAAESDADEDTTTVKKAAKKTTKKTAKKATKKKTTKATKKKDA